MECKFCHNTYTKFGLKNHETYHCKLNPNRLPKYKHTDDDKRRIAQTKYLKNPVNIYDVSSRTRTKIIQRLGIGCSQCGWNEAHGDLHHIVSKKLGGTNDDDNLSYLCPNCHRLAHENKITRLKSLTEQTTELNDSWRNYFYSHDTD